MLEAGGDYGVALIFQRLGDGVVHAVIGAGDCDFHGLGQGGFREKIDLG